MDRMGVISAEELLHMQASIDCLKANLLGGVDEGLIN
jgi:hypothetical protein